MNRNKRWVLLVTFAIGTAACGIGTPEPITPAARAAATPVALSPEVARVRIAVPRGQNSQVDDALVGALTAAGFIVVPGAQEHDVTVAIAATATPEQQFFVSNVNGVSNQRFSVAVRAAIQGPAGAIDQASTTFSSVGAAVTDQNLAPIAATFSRSQQLAAFAKAKADRDSARQEAKEAAEQKKEADKKAAADRDRKRQDDTAWMSARPVACTEPRRIEGCDGVQKYLTEFPEGAHADEARAALATGKPKLELVQKDENTWAGAGVEACRREHTRTDCAGVEVYLAKFPAGLHVDAAGQLLQGL